MQITKRLGMVIAVALTTTGITAAQQNPAAAKASAQALERLKAAGIIDATTDLRRTIRRQRSGATSKPSTTSASAKPATNPGKSGGLLSRLFKRDSVKRDSGTVSVKPKLRSAEPQAQPSTSSRLLGRFLPGRSSGSTTPGLSSPRSVTAGSRKQSWGRSRLNAKPPTKVAGRASKPRVAAAPSPKTASTKRSTPKGVRRPTRRVDELQQLVDRLNQRSLPVIRPGGDSSTAAQTKSQSHAATTRSPTSRQLPPQDPAHAEQLIPAIKTSASWGSFENPFTTRVTSESSAQVHPAKSGRVKAPTPVPGPSARPRVKPSPRATSRARSRATRDASLPAYKSISGNSKAAKPVPANPTTANRSRHATPVTPAKGTGNVTRTSTAQAGSVPGVRLRHATLRRVTPTASNGAKASTASLGRPTLSPTPSAAVLAARTLSREQRMQQIARRETLNGFKGFCPVELRDNRLLLTSQRQYSSKYARRTYFFSSRAAVMRFENDPLRYVPANGGRDIVLKATTGADRVGKLDHAAWYDDHLFLFTSAGSVNRFNQNPSRYAGPISRQ